MPNQIISIYLYWPEAELNVSCQFDNQYICGYDTHQYSYEDGIWMWKNDGGFNLQDGTQIEGTFCHIIFAY